MKFNDLKGFTLVELLAVIVILALILAIAIPSITASIRSSTMNAFESNAKMVLKAIEYKKIETDDFDPTSINKDNIEDILKVSSDNYSELTVVIDSGKPVVRMIGANKWSGLIACGTFNSIKVVDDAAECGVDSSATAIVFGTNGSNIYVKTRSTTVTVSDVDGINTSSLKYLWNKSATVPIEASFSTSFTNGGTINTPAGVTGLYYLWILAKDTANNVSITRSSVFKLDNIKPIITITGANPITINVGSTYTDAGATASDADSGINGSVTATSNINPSTAGTYTVTYTIGDNAGNTETAIRTIEVINSDYVANKGVNKPRLVTGMTPIKWNGSTWVNTTESDNDWYSYTAIDKKWANAKTADGSMWVWVPRYIYKINSGWHTSTAGMIEVQFSQGTIDNWNNSVIGNIEMGSTSNASNNKWTNHPAFTFGTTELTGVWIAKFEASAVEGTANGYTADFKCPTVGDNVSTKTIKILPNVISWRCMDHNNAFIASRNMETNSVYGWGTTGNNIDTHLMKNIEWGVVAYLSRSVYGQEANEIWINNANDFTTGCAANSVSQGASTTGCLNTYETTNGVKASTTGNIYGIYDLSGGSWEKVSAYVDNGNVNVTSQTAIINANQMYVDIYTIGATDAQADNYAAAINKKGDALYETSNSHTGNASWFADFSTFVHTTAPWFIRGGNMNAGNNGGIAGFYYNYSGPNSGYGFRPVLLVDAGL